MKVLLAHNQYLQPGGEDVVFRAERALLEQKGHDIVVYERHNSEIESTSPLNQISLLQQTIWSNRSQRDLRTLLAATRPDLAHFHNTFPLISPAAYYVCHDLGIPVVQTLHNYRLMCPASVFLRDGQICEDCLGKTLALPAVAHKCYRKSRTQSAAVTAMLAAHRILGTWEHQVDKYIVLTEFARQKFIQGGLPPEKLMVKPNFVHPDPGKKTGDGSYALFVGRMEAEKGLRTLLDAWRFVGNIPLKIAGDGELLESSRQFVAEEDLRFVELLGRLPHDEIWGLMKGARMLIFPSEWYEGYPLIIIEAFACGVPVIASRLGAMLDIIDDEITGKFFNPGDAGDLADKIQQLWERPDLAAQIGRNARLVYETLYTSEKNYHALMEIYQSAIVARPV